MKLQLSTKELLEKKISNISKEISYIGDNKIDVENLKKLAELKNKKVILERLLFDLKK